MEKKSCRVHIRGGEVEERMVGLLALSQDGSKSGIICRHVHMQVRIGNFCFTG